MSTDLHDSRLRASLRIRDQPDITFVLVVIAELDHVPAVKPVAIAAKKDFSPDRQQEPFACYSNPVILDGVLGQGYWKSGHYIKTRGFHSQYQLALRVDPE